LPAISQLLRNSAEISKFPGKGQIFWLGSKFHSPQKTVGPNNQDYVLPLTGPSRATARPGETFSRGHSGEKIFQRVFFSKWCILVYFIFLSDGRASKASRGPG